MFLDTIFPNIYVYTHARARAYINIKGSILFEKIEKFRAERLNYALNYLMHKFLIISLESRAV